MQYLWRAENVSVGRSCMNKSQSNDRNRVAVEYRDSMDVRNKSLAHLRRFSTIVRRLSAEDIHETSLSFTSK